MKRLLLLSVLLIVSACSFGHVYTNAIEEAEAFLTEKKYDEALKSVQIALEEKPEDEVALNIKSGLDLLKRLEDAEKKKDWDTVEKTIDEFAKLDSVHPSIMKDIDAIKATMKEDQAIQKELANAELELERLVGNSNFIEAEMLLEILLLDERYASYIDELEHLKTEFKSELEVHQNKLEKENKEIKLAEKKEVYQVELKNLDKNEKKLNKITEQEKFNKELSKEISHTDVLLNQLYADILDLHAKEAEVIREDQIDWYLGYDLELQKIEDQVEQDTYEYKEKKARLIYLYDTYMK